MNTREKQREEKLKEYIERRITNSIYVFISYSHIFLKIKNFYDIMAVLPKFEKELESYKILTNEDNFQKCKNKAIKEYKRQHSSRVSKEVKEMLDMPSLIKVDKHALCLKAAYYFKEYWDETLRGYKQKKARFNRLNYLINIISDDTFKTVTENYEDVSSLLKQYKEEYKLQRDALYQELLETSKRTNENR